MSVLPRQLVSYALAVFSACTVLFTANLVIQGYNPVLLLDQWEMVHDLQSTGGRVLPARLWVQHNEHRIPLTRLASYFDLFYFGGRNRLLLFLICVTQIAHWGVWMTVLYRWGPPDRALRISLAALSAYALFSPIQSENFVWAFQTQFVQVGLFASLTFALLIEHARHGRRWLLLAALGAACLAEVSLSNGLLVWPVLLAAGFALRLPRASMSWIAGVGLAGIVAYAIGFQFVARHTSPFYSVRHPWAVLRFVASYLAFSWDGSLPNHSQWPSLFEWIALIAIGWTLAQWRRREWMLLETYCHAVILFAVLSALATALVRLGFGTIPALQSRYQTVALTFWAALGILLGVRLSAARQPAGVPAWALAGVLVLLLSQIPRFGPELENARARKQTSEAAYATLIVNPGDLATLSTLSADPEALPGWYAFLREHHWDLDPAQIAGAIEEARHGALSEPRLDGFTVTRPGRCLGSFDELRAVDLYGGSVATGWAWDVQSGDTPESIMLAEATGAPVAETPVEMPRTDVKKAVPQVLKVNVGWQVNLKAKQGLSLRAFGILPGRKTACLLLNEWPVPRIP